MPSEYLIQPKSLTTFIKVLSGYFSLTKKEGQVLAALIHIMNENNSSKVDKNIKKELCRVSNFGFQIVTNYVNVLKKKKAIKDDGTLHPVLTKQRVIIEYGKVA